jgi:hypothetical protein
MNFQEYLAKFEEILERTEEIEKANNGHNNKIYEEAFNRRKILLEELVKIEIDFEITPEQVEQLKKIKKEIQKKNEAIIRMMKVKQAGIKQELLSKKQETKIIDA